MPFVKISGQNIRNLKDYDLKPSPSINIISGKNGAGKTNLLEAIYLNALGRSFRTSSTRSVISEAQSKCWVFSEFESHSDDYTQLDKIGLERAKPNTQKLSINGVHQNSLAKLAAIAPVIALQPSETELIDGSSSLRRKYLDWLVFHVEPNFLSLWRDNQRILKQRNRLLRLLSAKPHLTHKDHIELNTWLKPYLETCSAINEMREGLMPELSSTLVSYLSRIPAFCKTINTTTNNESDASSDTSINVKLAFQQGWLNNITLQEALELGLEQDLKRGFTKAGSHRGDVLIKANSVTAKDYLSRGQKKLLAMLMRLAQAKELGRLGKALPVILVDDLFAELDHESVKGFVEIIEGLDTQVFLSCLNTESEVSELFSNEAKVFHVERGLIS